MQTMPKISEMQSGRIAVCLLCLLLAGCGSVTHKTTLEPGFVPQGAPFITVGKITNVSPASPKDEAVELNPVETLKTQLTQKLKENGMLSPPETAGKNYELVSEIREYRPGSAFKRWLLPGYGSTILRVGGTLRLDNKKVGEISADRTIDAGGAYTAGAYESIFGDVAEDIVTELKEKLAPAR